MCETEAIVNSRPLAVANISSPTDAEPLTPNHLLTMKSRMLLPPPGEFQRADLYLVKRWRRVQYLADLFWLWWREDFLCTLQERPKWNKPRRNMCVGDIQGVSKKVYSWEKVDKLISAQSLQKLLVEISSLTSAVYLTVKLFKITIFSVKILLSRSTFQRACVQK